MSAEQNRNAGSGDPHVVRRSAGRIKHTVRFSDPEWKQVRQAAERRGITASEYVRNAVMSAADGSPETETTALSPALVQIIRLTHRSAYILSTLKRDEMIREGRAHEIDEVVRAARNAQDDIFNSRSQRHDDANP